MTPAPDPKGQGRKATPSRPAEPSPAAQGATNAAGESGPEAGTGLRPANHGEVFFSESELTPVPVPAGRPAPGPATPPASGDGKASPNVASRRIGAPGQPEPTSRAGLYTALRLGGGLLTLAVLAYLMYTPGEWTTSLMAWVLLVILADEFGGWFGYLGLLLGGLGYFGPHTPPEQWLVILPLVGGALMALLLVKHSGGILVLPFAGALFAGVLLGVSRFGLKFDPELKLPANETFLRSALLAMLLGLGISFLRQLTGMFLRRRARLQARQRAANQTPSPA